MFAQDPLEEINLRDGPTKRVTYFSAKLDPKMKSRYVEWIANIVPVIKKNGSLRVCIDFRDLNAATLKDEYPILVAEMPVGSAAGYEYLSMLDDYSGYNKIFIAEEDVSITAFRCPGVYINNIVIKSISGGDHLTHLSQSFERMRKHGLKMNPLKCAFCVQDGDFMGFVVHKKGIEINQNKTKAIMETKAPSTKKELQSLLGKINFLRRFISNLSGRIQAFFPLLHLKHGSFEWTNEHQEAFEKIKQYLMNPPILSPPSGKKPMRLYEGASSLRFYSGSRSGRNPRLLVELKPWRLFFDGSTHKDGSGFGILLISPDGIPTKLKYRIEEPLCSNNEAEYEALIAGLEALLELGATRVEIKYIKHVPRIKNQEANDLAQIASGYKISREKLKELVEVRGKEMTTKLSPSDLERNRLGYANKEEFKVLAIDTLTSTYWRTPIIEYLKDPLVNTDRKTKYRALSCMLMGNELFKKTPEGILLKCLGENEAYLALPSVHSGTCGAHQAGHKMKWLLFRYGIYWPTMLKDCIEFAKGCQECQIHAGI
ncbi:uncharacterized protein LOC131661365 [Vicia villosa]|uniref:uncharacterized protein LOC131661365 n=1 Tax=Vicia villosa TaxID=3911 RepID=UPI00273B25F7|nr:uncharacterized protein LOC131661365 [Vicia villosa]